MIYGYISQGYYPNEEQKDEIVAYAQTKSLKMSSIIEDDQNNKEHWGQRFVSEFLKDTLQCGDELVIYEVANLARSTAQMLEIFELLVERRIKLHLAKYSEVFDAAPTVDTYHFLGLMRHIESDFVAKRTTEALARRRAAGLPLGRPKGRLNKSLKLDKHRKDIQKYLNLHVSKASIAKLIGCHAQTLYNYIDARQLKPQCGQPAPSKLSEINA